MPAPGWNLSLMELSLIDHVFVTHSPGSCGGHPFIVNRGGMRAQPLTVYAIPATLESCIHFQLEHLADFADTVPENRCSDARHSAREASR
jgi:hypothetical protein